MTARRRPRAGWALAAVGAVGSWVGLLATWAAEGTEGLDAAVHVTALVWTPWLLAAGIGVRAWLARRARGPDRTAHACAVLAVAVPGILLAAFGIGSASPGTAMGCGALVPSAPAWSARMSR